MNILFLTKGSKTLGSSRQRVWFVAEELKRRYGHKCEIIYGLRHTVFELSSQRFSNLSSVFSKLRSSKINTVFVHKSFFPWDVIILILLSKWILGHKLIFDLDDAEWLHSQRKTEFLARHADVIFCGSQNILSWAKEFNKTCLLMPTVVHAGAYAKYSILHAERDVYTIGWTGLGPAHYKDGSFHIIKPVLDKLADSGVKLRFVIIGSQEHQPLKDLFVGTSYDVLFPDAPDWESPEAVPSLIKKYEFDVGVMPIVDLPFNRFKCAFKAIEYMASGVPVVSSDVGEIRRLIEEGKEGFIAVTEEEWLSSIQKLLADKSLRQAMGKSGQEKVKRSYSFDFIIPQIQGYLQS